MTKFAMGQNQSDFVKKYYTLSKSIMRRKHGVVREIPFLELWFRNLREGERKKPCQG
jgi:hypothetical protein